MEVFFFPLFLSIFFFFFLRVHAQQPYVAMQTTLCNLTDNASSAFGYSCNGVNTTCQSYLTFRSTPPYTSVSSISTLLASNPSELANLNSVSVDSTFEANTLVLIPVTCSCSGQYYQVNTTYTVQQGNTGFFPIANNTFQGLSVCDAIAAQNPGLSAGTLSAGNRVRVPLRCACPTKNQIDSGTNYLLSYLVASGDFIFRIRSMFGLSTDDSVFQANELSSSNSGIFPFTTLLLPLQDPPTVSQTISPPPPPATPPPPFTGVSTTNGPSNNNLTWVYALVGAVVAVLFILVLIWFFLFRNKKKMNDPVPVTVPVSSSEGFEAVEKSDSILLKDISVISQSLKVYSFKELEIGTSNFSPSCLIKGSVYRGRINGDLAAIKRMDGDVSKEIELMNKISHFNLLRLSGVCFNGENWYLVHEYAARGSLSDWIFITDGAEENFLSWTQRIQVALDVATGLNYIHNYTSPPCIHGDVKSSNILLDDEFRGKIANFTLARTATGEDGPFALTKHIVGTQGYMAPEYLENGLISTKIDVYAFGILLTEILTGNEAGGKTDLSDVLESVLDGGNGVKAFMDPRLEGKYPEDLAVFVLRTANGCVKREPSRRPGMDEVLQSLSRIRTGSLAWEASRLA